MKALSCIFLLLALVWTATAADITGKWSGTFALVGDDGKPGAPSSAFMIAKQTGTTITGTGGPDETQQWPIQDGKIAGNKITCRVTSPDGVIYTLTLTLDGDQITGDAVMSQGDQSQKAKVEFKRVK